MEKEEPGKRYDYFYKFDSGKKEYDWRHKSVISHISSHVLWNSDNEIVQYTLGIIENSLRFIMNYIDKLRGFKNYNKYNR